MVDETNEMDCGLKEIKMKHDQWSDGWMKWDETLSVKCRLKEMKWNMNNEIDNVINARSKEQTNSKIPSNILP